MGVGRGFDVVELASRAHRTFSISSWQLDGLVHIVKLQQGILDIGRRCIGLRNHHFMNGNPIHLCELGKIKTLKHCSQVETTM